MMNSFGRTFSSNIAVVIIIVLTASIEAFPTGAPVGTNPEICTSLTPGHGYTPQTSPAPFTITSLDDRYTMGGFHQVRIQVTDPAVTYLGFILQARMVGTTTIIGQWLLSQTGAQVVQCSNPFDTVTHDSNAAKPANILYLWSAPSTSVGDVEFVATFVVNESTYWVGVKSAAISPSYCSFNGQICQNNGICQDDSLQLFRCNCTNTGYTGRTCNELIETCAIVGLCQNGGQCFTPASGQGFFCNCPIGFTGSKCEDTVDFCSPNPCQNGKPCTSNVDGFTCDCGSEYLDNTCSIRNFCENAPCQNGGTCTNNADNTNFQCTCVSPFMGNRCETRDYCEGDPCQNSRPCSNNDDDTDFECDCGNEYVGDMCEFTNHCQTFPCRNEGICSNNPTNTGFECDCTDVTGFTGPTCNDPIVTPCDPNPCQNGGTCTVDGSDFQCQCTTMYDGPTCAIQDFCANDPCQNMRPCSNNNDNSNFQCDCGSEYLGNTCDRTNHCASDPCKNGASCSNNADDTSFVCDCMGTGFTGPTCEDAVTTPSTDCVGSEPCQNGGRCLNGACVCEPGYTGQLCERDIDDCNPNPCPTESSTNCIDLVDGFSCVCKTGYAGVLCEENIGGNETETGVRLLIQPWWIAIICLIAVLVIILMFLAACTCRTTKGKAPVSDKNAVA